MTIEINTKPILPPKDISAVKKQNRAPKVYVPPQEKGTPLNPQRVNWLNPISILAYFFASLLALFTAKPAEVAPPSPHPALDDLLKKYGKWVVGLAPQTVSREGVIKVMNLMLGLVEIEKPTDMLQKELFTEAHRSVILQEYQKELEAPFAPLKDDFAHGLPPRRDVVLKKYPELKGNQEFERILSEAWIQNKMKKVTESRGSSTERKVLENLGFESQDEEFVKEALTLILESYLSAKELPLVEELQVKFQRKAFDVRLLSVKVKPEELANFRSLFRFYQVERQKLLDEAKSRVEGYLNPLPKAQDLLRDLLFDHYTTLIDAHFQKFFETHRKKIREKIKAVDFDPAKLSRSPIRLEGKSKKLEKAEAWFKKYGSQVHTEFVQGEKSEDEVLGRGVCLALCVRFLKENLANPAKIFVIDQIKPIDRLFQAYHVAHDRKSTKLPPEILAKAGLKEKERFQAVDDETVFAKLKELIPQLKGNSGLFFSWGNHATALRYDPEKKIYLFFDPNLGTLQFKKGSQETDERLASRIATAYVELYNWAYPERGEMRATQLNYTVS